MSGGWHHDAACAQPGATADDWIIGTEGQLGQNGSQMAANRKAREICNTCPVRIPCRDEMLADYRPRAYPVGVILAGWRWPSGPNNPVQAHPDDRHLLRVLGRRRQVTG